MHDLLYRSVLTTLGIARPILPQRALFLCLHSISDGDFPGGMAVKAGFLDALVRDTRSVGVPILSLSDALASLAADAAKPFLALTFDDGYRGVFTHAYPVLRRLAVPFAIFATTGLVDGHHPMWWDAVERLVAAQGSVQIDGKTIPTRSRAQRASALALVGGMLRATPPEQQKAALGRLQSENPALDVAAAFGRALTWPMLRQMLDSGLLTVGAHTVTHPLLANLTAAAIEDEFVASRRRIQSELGVDVAFMAYPFGQPDEIGPHAERAAENAGYRAAFTTVARPLRSGAEIRLLALPRALLSHKAQSPLIVSAYMSGVPDAIKRQLRGSMA